MEKGGMEMSKVLLSWELWVYGLFAALIGGGTAAIGTGFAQAITDPGHADVKHLLALMGTSFIVSGILSAAAYLAKSPLPPIVTTTEVEKSITPTAAGGVSIKTTSVTTEEPKESSK
jgi:hypothetical protein